MLIKQDENGNQKISYEKTCHEPCKLPFVEAETVGRLGMVFCRKMLFGRSCKECGHSWRVHMQISYEMKRERVRVIDKDKQKLLNENQNSKAVLDNFIRRLETYIEELKNEQAVITNICAQFGCYLKKNSITPFNDAVDSHLDMLIWQEEGKCPPNQSAIKNLEGMKEKYQQDKMVLCRAMEQPDSSNIQYISEPGQVDELQQRLFDLKHNGQSLREIFEANRRARDERYNDLAIEPIQLIPRPVRGMYNYLKKNVEELFKKK